MKFINILLLLLLVLFPQVCYGYHITAEEISLLDRNLVELLNITSEQKLELGKLRIELRKSDGELKIAEGEILSLEKLLNESKKELIEQKSSLKNVERLLKVSEREKNKVKAQRTMWQSVSALLIALWAKSL